MDVMRTLVSFDHDMLAKKENTGLTWQEIFELGLQYQMYLIEIGEAKKVDPKERKNRKKTKSRA